MSDREFMKSFSSLIVALVVLTVVLFIVAQMVGGKSKSPEIVAADTKAVAERIKPIGEVSVGTNSVMDAIIPSANAAGADKGKTIYDASCAACHATGVAGAPKLGDKSAWGTRIAQGNNVLHDHAIKGFQGKVGVMPAKGGNASLKDDDVKAAVDYMAAKSK